MHDVVEGVVGMCSRASTTGAEANTVACASCLVVALIPHDCEVCVDEGYDGKGDCGDVVYV